ncbi:MAG TPA: HPr(Ser) kinase/phosphatase, partial [Gemmatimonadaceae bacterium]|nr:HPr(Ser) kinase/phosphatase [Gemmatimonadaceae bacterium]
MGTPLTVGRFFERMRERLQLEQVPGADAPQREIRSLNVSSPGLVLSGYVDRFPAQRIQVIGETEMAYLSSLSSSDRRTNLRVFFAFAIPCVVITKALQPTAEMIEEARAAGVPMFTSRLKTHEFYSRIKPWLEDEFAPTANLHGSLADVFGVGLLFIGRSGIGKSECVLDLVERGHRLVADDLVLVKRRGSDLLIGRGHELQRHHMEIRGIGLVDIPAIFGIRAVRQQKRIEVVVQLEEWHREAVVDRTGLDAESTTILE